MAESLVTEWRARASALGFDDAAITELLHSSGRVAAPMPGTPAAEILFAELASPTGLTAHAASFGRREVIQAIAAGLPTAVRSTRTSSSPTRSSTPST